MSLSTLFCRTIAIWSGFILSVKPGLGDMHTKLMCWEGLREETRLTFPFKTQPLDYRMLFCFGQFSENVFYSYYCVEKQGSTEHSQFPRSHKLVCQNHLASLAEPKTDMMKNAMEMKYELTVKLSCVVFQPTPHIKTTTLAHT